MSWDSAATQYSTAHFIMTRKCSSATGELALVPETSGLGQPHSEGRTCSARQCSSHLAAFLSGACHAWQCTTYLEGVFRKHLHCSCKMSSLQMPPRPALTTSPGTSTWVLARFGAACGTIPAASLGLSFLTLAILPPPVHLPAGAATTAAEWTCAAVTGCQLNAVCILNSSRFYLKAAGTPQPLDGCHPRIRLAAVTPPLKFNHVCPLCRATETGYCVNAACFLTMNVCIL